MIAIAAYDVRVGDTVLLDREARVQSYGQVMGRTLVQNENLNCRFNVLVDAKLDTVMFKTQDKVLILTR